MVLSCAVLVFGEPARIDQAPVPCVGVFAANVVDTLLKQMVWSGPAFEVVVAGVMLRATSAVLDAQGLLLMVQRTTTGPAPPVCVKVEEPLAELLKVPVPPLTTLQAPVPELGVFPPREEEVPEVQMVCVPPTVEVVGRARTMIATSSVLELHGLLLMVQRRLYVPEVVGVKVAVDEPVLLSWAVLVLGEPARMDHVPVPCAGVLAASVVETLPMQIV